MWKYKGKNCATHRQPIWKIWFLLLKILFAQVIVMLKKNWMFTWTTPLTMHSPLVTSHLCYQFGPHPFWLPPVPLHLHWQGAEGGWLVSLNSPLQLVPHPAIPLGHLPTSALISLLHSFKVLCHMSLCNFSNLLMKILIIYNFFCCHKQCFEEHPCSFISVALCK